MRLLYFILLSGLALPVFAIYFIQDQKAESYRWCIECVEKSLPFDWLDFNWSDLPIKRLGECVMGVPQIIKVKN